MLSLTSSCSLFPRKCAFLSPAVARIARSVIGNAVPALPAALVKIRTAGREDGKRGVGKFGGKVTNQPPDLSV